MRRGVAAGLRDPDPDIRVAAVVQAAELGLASTASALLRCVRAEKDPTVLASVVRTVAARQWEPASTSGIVELRLWARAYAETATPRSGRRTPASPMLAGIAGTVPPPSLDPSRAEEFRTRRDHVPASPHGAEPAAAVAEPDPDPLHPTTVLVTGAGGPAGVAVIRALLAAGHRSVALDADESAVGLRLTEESTSCPASYDPHYLAAMLRAATVSSAQALICTVAEEYAALTLATPYLEEAGVRDDDAVAGRGRAPASTSGPSRSAMAAAGVPVPATGLASAEGIAGPWVVKPRFGRGSRDIHLVSTVTQLPGAPRARCPTRSCRPS